MQLVNQIMLRTERRGMCPREHLCDDADDGVVDGEAVVERRWP